MKKNIGVAARRELVFAIGQRYRASSKRERESILDEFVAVTGYHRKHSIRLLNAASSAKTKNKRVVAPRLPVYDAAVREALVMLWEASDRVCGKRLKPLLPSLVDALERHGHLALEPSVRARVLKASAATLDRLLAEPRSRTDGKRRNARASKLLRSSIRVRTFSDWHEPPPGFMEADLVAHAERRLPEALSTRSRLPISRRGGRNASLCRFAKAH